jgi:hypothetical protein
MMEPGSHGMMNGRNMGWIGGIPFIGGVLGVAGLVGGALYWVQRRGRSAKERTDPAIATLRSRYARGEIDEQEYRQRRERLADNDDQPPSDIPGREFGGLPVKHPLRDVSRSGVHADVRRHPR